MRFKEFKTVLREATGNLYTIGDSHAVAVATAGGKDWTNLAIGGRSSTDSAMLANIAKVPKGATVLVSQGANDTANAARAHMDSQGKRPLKPAQTIASNVANVVSKVQAQGATVIFLLFPNGPGRGAGLAKYYGGDYQEEVRNAIKSALSGVQIIDINGKPLTDGVHATMGVYKEVAGQVASKVTTPSTGNKPNLDTIAGFKRDGSPIVKPVAGAASAPGTTPSAPAAFNVTVPTSKRSPAVADLQKALMALGYDLPRHGVDGIRGPETNGAIKKFQADNSLEASGEPNRETVAKLNDILKSKPEVASKLKQSTLADIGYQRGSGAGRSGAAAGSTGNAKKAVEYFIAKGWTPEQSAGIVGNLQAESGANLKIDAVGDGGLAYGIAQWHPPRQANFAKAYGKNIRGSTLEDQLAFIQWELDNTESKAASWLKRAKTTDEAAWVFDKYYERSAGLHTSQRVANAAALLSSTATV